MPKSNSSELYINTFLNLIKKSGSEDVNKITDWVLAQELKTRTKHNYLNSIVSLHKHCPHVVKKGDINKAKKERDRLQVQINEDVKADNITERQRKVLDTIDWSDIVKYREKLEKSKGESKEKMEDYLLLVLMDPPMRNDLQEIQICSSKKSVANCLYLPKKKGGEAVLYVRDHKTTSRGGKPIIRKLDASVTEDIKSLISDGRKWLFVDKKGNPYSSSGFTHRLNTLFKKEFGSDLNISSTVLRKLYLSSKYKDVKRIKREMDEDAKAMGHSSETAMTHYVADGE